MKKVFITIATALLCSLMLSMAALANSAPVYVTSGDAARGIIPLEEVPLTVEKEILTFDIPNLQSEGVDYDITNATEHSGTVTAEYYFQNPSSETVNVKLAFAQGVERMNPSCDVRINGTPLETEIRYTYIGNGEDFYGPEDVKRIQDDYVADDFFTPQMPVTEYEFCFSKLPSDENEKAFFNYTVPDGNRTRILLPCSPSQTGEYFRWVEKGETVKVQVIGETEGVQMSWSIGESLTVMPEKSYEMTLGRFATEILGYMTGISDVDCYNVMVKGMNAARHFELMPSFMTEDGLSTTMWIEYEFSIGPGEEAVNSVKAILAPEWYNYRKNPEYTYYYLLSPAQCWRKFGSLDVVINTPHPLYGNSQDEYEKTETGYKKHFESLPAGELSFCLTPEGSSGGGNGGTVAVTLILIVIIIVAVVLVIGLIVAVIVIISNIVKGKKKKNKDQGGI